MEDSRYEETEFGTIIKHSHPALNNAQHLLVSEVNLRRGSGHHFHKHPNQEELIYVLEGEVEQWLAEKKMVLSQGESILIPANTVHASFNTSGVVRLLVIYPCLEKGSADVATIEVSTQSPWDRLRKSE